MPTHNLCACGGYMVPGLACCAVGAARVAKAKATKVATPLPAGMPAAHSLTRTIALPSGRTYKLAMASHRGAVRPNAQRSNYKRPHVNLVGQYTRGAARATGLLRK